MPQQSTVRKIFHFPCSLRLWLLAAAVAVGLSFGCSPQIGDACETDNDCPEDPNVVCDTTVEGGFCTIKDCRPGDCPSEAVCVEFDRHDSYCMRSCQTDEQCRPDHTCIYDEDIDTRYCFVDS